MRKSGTKEKVLLEGQALLQKHGYHGFSFQDIANQLDIKKQSLYDHFASKEDLMIAIINRYGERFDAWTETVAELEPIERIRRVFDIFHAFSEDKRKVCPVLSLSADFQSLSKPVRNGINAFVEKWLAWLEVQIKEGQKRGQIRSDMKAKQLASLIYSQGIGAQFQARIKDAPELTIDSGKFVVSFLRT